MQRRCSACWGQSIPARMRPRRGGGARPRSSFRTAVRPREASPSAPISGGRRHGGPSDPVLIVLHGYRPQCRRLPRCVGGACRTPPRARRCAGVRPRSVPRPARIRGVQYAHARPARLPAASGLELRRRRERVRRHLRLERRRGRTLLPIRPFRRWAVRPPHGAVPAGRAHPGRRRRQCRRLHRAARGGALSIRPLGLPDGRRGARRRLLRPAYGAARRERHGGRTRRCC